MNTNKNGPIIIIEDDADDREIFNTLYTQLGYENKLIFLEDGKQALEYLTNLTVVPFIIISDINMPKIDGLQLRGIVSNNHSINFLCIPYIILSTTAEKQFVDIAYSTGVQGFFQKPSSHNSLRDMLKIIIEYWKSSRAPGNYITLKK